MFQKKKKKKKKQVLSPFGHTASGLSQKTKQKIKNKNLMYLPSLEKVSRKNSSDMEEKTGQEQIG